MTGESQDSAPAGGVYSVRESGIEFVHAPQELPTPKDGDEFLARFRYVRCEPVLNCTVLNLALPSKRVQPSLPIVGGNAISRS